MLMAVSLCYEENLTVDISIMALILVNVLGFLLGNLGAQVLLNFLPSVWKNIVSTVVVTEMMGWALYWFAHTFSPTNAASYDRKLSWKRRRGLLVGSIAVIFGLRVYIDLSYQGNIFQESAIVGILVIISVALLGFMIRYATKMQLEATDQRTRRHQAEFRYMTLKSQVDPHFLFNSLNVLDSIVLEGTPQEASAYIHKLASIYRYLMQHEAKKLVPLSEEIQFARTYRELMQIRFPEGLVLEDRLGADIPSGYIIPCTLQLLLENAIKHNAISPENPLIVSVFTDGKSITMRNTRIPKVSTRPSTGIGLQYIRNQYRDLADAEITVTQTLDSFAVTVPILEDSK
jgi:sensor histidine kinase YesM